jgi:hypothetical protein
MTASQNKSPSRRGANFKLPVCAWILNAAAHVTGTSNEAG